MHEQLKLFDLPKNLPTTSLDGFLKTLAKSNCQECNLGRTRRNIVTCRGDALSGIIMVGEGPGAQEDLTGIPFWGRSGKLLDELILEVFGPAKILPYLTNVVKCRCPNNRLPHSDEIKACGPYLNEELIIIERTWQETNHASRIIIVPLGSTATKFFGVKGPMEQKAGHFFKSIVLPGQNPFLICPTYHPAFCLRQPRRINEVKTHFTEIKKACLTNFTG